MDPANFMIGIRIQQIFLIGSRSCNLVWEYPIQTEIRIQYIFLIVSYFGIFSCLNLNAAICLMEIRIQQFSQESFWILPVYERDPDPMFFKNRFSIFSCFSCKFYLETGYFQNSKQSFLIFIWFRNRIQFFLWDSNPTHILIQVKKTYIRTCGS